MTFRTPSLPGSSQQDSPSLAGWGCGFSGPLEDSRMKPLYDRLRCSSEPPNFDELGIPEAAQRVFCEAMGRYILDDAHGMWMEPDSRDGHCDPETLVEALATRMSEMNTLFNGPRITSPIEALLAPALLWLRCNWAGLPSADGFDGPDDHMKNFGASNELLYYITPQATIGKYKADFLIWFSRKKYVHGVVVECDGHDFHERTKEQAGRDKRRDREILAAGYPVVRFTGSEIFKDPFACAQQVLDVLHDSLTRVSKDSGLMSGH